MDTRLQNHFGITDLRRADLYVADYTDRTDSQRGVEFSEQPFDDIQYFHLKNNPKAPVPYIAVNFERHPAFIKGIQNCECMFHAMSGAKRPWTLFLEMKYCETENIEGYTYKAYTQMKETLDRLATLQLIEPADRRIYFVYSIPEHSEAMPFGAFTLSQNDTLRTYEQSGIKLLGNNTLLIATATHLFEPRRPV